MKYYVFRYNEDGDVPAMEIYTEAALLRMLKEDYEGCTPPKFADGPFDQDHPDGRIVVIRGELVVPQPAQVVKTWKVEP